MTTCKEPTRANREGDTQPLPTSTSTIDIIELVRADLAARRDLGIERYGQPLAPHNGRNALVDAYEETLDLANYLKQRIVEDELAQLADDMVEDPTDPWRRYASRLEALVVGALGQPLANRVFADLRGEVGLL